MKPPPEMSNAASTRLADVAANVGLAGKTAADVFTEVRARKNKF